MKTRLSSCFSRAIAVAALLPTLAYAQARADADAIHGIAISTIAKAAGKKTAGEVVFWADSAAERRRLALLTEVKEASAAQLGCREHLCREPAEGVTVLVVTSPPTILSTRATLVVEEFRGLRTAAGQPWTDRILHTLNLEKRRGVWVVTSGTTRAPGVRRL